MSSVTITHEEIIQKAKCYIKNDDIINLELYYKYLNDNDIEYNEEYVYQKVFIYACIICAKNCIKWLFTIYDEFLNTKNMKIEENIKIKK